jgi:hypothetical protein
VAANFVLALSTTVVTVTSSFACSVVGLLAVLNLSDSSTTVSASSVPSRA